MRTFDQIYKELKYYGNFKGNKTSLQDAFNIFIAEIKEDLKSGNQEDLKRFQYILLNRRGWAQSLDLKKAQGQKHGFTVKMFLQKMYEDFTVFCQ